MRIEILALCLVVSFSGLASRAAAQREPLMVLRADVSPSTATHGSTPHLAADDTMELRAPDAGDYVLPVLGVVLGGAATLAGVVGVLGSAFVLLVDDSPGNAGAWLGGSAGLAVLGALSLGFSIAGLRSLHHRSEDAEPETTGVQVLQFTPTPGGAVLGVAGTY